MKTFATILVSVFLAGSTTSAFAARPVGRSNPGVVEDIRYVPGGDSQTLSIDYQGAATMRMTRRPEAKQIIVEIDGVNFPGTLARRIDSSAMPGPVTEISPYNVGGELRGSKVVIQLRENSNVVEEKAPGEYRLVFMKDKAVASAGGGGKLRPWGRRPGFAREDKDSLRVRAGAPDRSLEIAEELIRTLDTPLETRVYKGTKITIESDNVDVHDVFRLVGTASGLNIITTSDVGGTVSLSLKDIPWDQLLDIVMQERQLKAINNGNVIRITSIANYNREQEAKLALQVVEKKIEPVLMAIIPINYANAGEIRTSISTLLVGAIGDTGPAPAAPPAGAPGSPPNPQTQTATSVEDAVQAFSRGKIEVDPRTNSLLVTHTAEQIKRIRALVRELDVPTPQVLIEGKIVQATETFSRSLGVNWGGFFQGGPPGGTNTNAGGGVFAVNQFNSAAAFSGSNTGGSGLLGFRIGTGGQAHLDFSLSLAEVNSQVKIMASPRVIVNNNRSATISDGTKIATTTTTTTGATSTQTVSFVDATLTLTVTPQVTNSGQVLLAPLTVSQDVPIAAGAVRDIQTKNVDTNVLVDSGSTLVLGGVYSYTLSKDNQGVPWLKDLPILGNLFKTKTASQNRSELLIFVTPRVIEATAMEERDIEDEGITL